jgi:aminopeptidase N
MGIWGVGNFENDDAYDWVYEVEETNNLAYIIETLKAVAQNDDYLEAQDCARAIAAAEVVAAIKGKGSPDAPHEIKAWIKNHSFQVSKSQIVLALKAIEKVKMGSELAQMWQDTDEAETWFDVINYLEARLSVK